ncbi:unnamed protein product [Amoebophrya sp. A25]|nr:unnamed protein product [Amoebophrya sp. A25]|eukprot:GSA25T00002795001.1
MLSTIGSPALFSDSGETFPYHSWNSDPFWACNPRRPPRMSTVFVDRSNDALCDLPTLQIGGPCPRATPQSQVPVPDRSERVMPVTVLEQSANTEKKKSGIFGFLFGSSSKSKAPPPPNPIHEQALAAERKHLELQHERKEVFSKGIPASQQWRDVEDSPGLLRAFPGTAGSMAGSLEKRIRSAAQKFAIDERMRRLMLQMVGTLS